MKIFVIRHGEAEDDLDDSYGGAADFKLTDNGRDQARQVGDTLKDRGVQAIYNSPLARAFEAAAIIRERLGDIPIQTIGDLRERNSYGVLSGLTKKRAAELFGYILDALSEKPGYSREPLMGAEDFDAFVGRVSSAFNSIVADARVNGYETIALVTHGKFTQALFEETLKINKNVYLDLSAINEIEYTPFSASLVSE